MILEFHLGAAFDTICPKNIKRDGRMILEFHLGRRLILFALKVSNGAGG